MSHATHLSKKGARACSRYTMPILGEAEITGLVISLSHTHTHTHTHTYIYIYIYIVTSQMIFCPTALSRLISVSTQMAFQTSSCLFKPAAVLQTLRQRWQINEDMTVDATWLGSSKRLLFTLAFSNWTKICRLYRKWRKRYPIVSREMCLNVSDISSFI